MHGITVGMPAFNARKTIEQALKSTIDQTVKVPYEVVVIDDGSTDTTANIALHYELKRPGRVRLIRTANGGVAAARNLVVKESRYDLLTWLDSDDYYYAHKLELQYEAYLMRCMVQRCLPSDPCTIVLSPFDMAEKLYSFTPYLRDPVKHLLTGEFRAYLWASITAKSSYLTTGPFNETLHRLEDTDWMIRFLRLHNPSVTVTGEEPLMRYHFSTDREGRKVEDSLDYFIANYGEMMREAGVYDEYVPRRYLEIANFYHRNKRWDDMWRCRTMAAALDPARYEGLLQKELAQLRDPGQRHHIERLVTRIKSEVQSTRTVVPA